MIAEWAARYVGIPYATHGRDYAGLDCWGLVKRVQSDVFGVQLPDYSERYRDGDDWPAISAAVADGVADGWKEIDKEQPGDLLILRIAARPWHCGVVVGPAHFMHASPHDRVVIERFDSPRWARRISGIYRYG